MGRKAKLSFEEKLELVKEYLEKNITAKILAKKYHLYERTVRKFVSIYRMHGADGLKEVGSRNRSYTKEFKSSVMEEYINGASISRIMIKYLISSTVVKNWINQYNRGILKEYNPKGEIYSMRSPKLSKEAKLNIAKECIENGKNYKDICTKYGVNYSNLYSWVVKYEKKQITNEINSASSDKQRYEILLKLKEKEIELLKAENEILKKNEEILERLKKK